jgi:transposase-like protein
MGKCPFILCTYLAFPESYLRRICTTNGRDRLNQEVKRRTRVVGIYTALASEQSEEWVTGRRYLDMEELRERRYRERGGGGHGAMRKDPS